MKIAIYTRVSTTHQIDKDSLPLQKNDLKNYCEYILNTKDYVIFEDAGYSGKNTIRPAYMDMMSRIKHGEFSHMLVWKIDRISRNLLDFCAMYDEIKKYGCTFISKNEQFDTSSAMGEAMLKIILVFAELERKLTGERVTAIMLDRATKGLWNGAPIPLGYTWDDKIKFPVIDAEEQQTVMTIYEKYKDTHSTTAVREFLNTNRIRTKRDGSWTTKTIADIIRNPFYKGTYRYNHRESAHGKKKAANELILVEDNHPGIISKELWEECNAIMDINAQRNNASSFRDINKVHVFAGLLKCSECNNSYYAKQDKPHLDGYYPSIYVCSGRYNNLGCNQKTVSDKLVGTFLLTFISNVLKLKNIRKNINAAELEKKLLTGSCFKDVAGIKNIDELYKMLTLKQVNILSPKKIKGKDNNIDMIALNRDREKFIRALERLEDLYLFDDVNMSEKDYLIKKKKIDEKIVDIDKKLMANRSSSTYNGSIKELTFLVQTSNSLMAKTLADADNIDYKGLILELERKTMKEFVNSILEKIDILDKHVLRISFKNGLVTEFVYR